MDAFKWKHFEAHIILTVVRWYLRYREGKFGFDFLVFHYRRMPVLWKKGRVGYLLRSYSSKESDEEVANEGDRRDFASKQTLLEPRADGGELEAHYTGMAELLRKR